MSEQERGQGVGEPLAGLPVVHFHGAAAFLRRDLAFVERCAEGEVVRPVGVEISGGESPTDRIAIRREQHVGETEAVRANGGKAGRAVLRQKRAARRQSAKKRDRGTKSGRRRVNVRVWRNRGCRAHRSSSQGTTSDQ